jgi:hypothetical protein
MSQFNQKKQHFAVKIFAPPAIKGETFLKLTVTVRRWTTSLPRPFSPAWSANSKTHYPNTFKMEPSMSSHGIQKNLISVSVKYSSCGSGTLQELRVLLCTTWGKVTKHIHSFHWHVQNATIPCLSQELLLFLSVIYFFLPPLPSLHLIYTMNVSEENLSEPI